MASYADVIEGLEILARNHPEGKAAHGIAAEHDVIYGASSDIELPEEDRERLEELRWFVAKDVDSWARFV